MGAEGNAGFISMPGIDVADRRTLTAGTKVLAVCGRKPVVTEEKLRRACQLMAKGLTAREAAARIKVGKTALYNALQRQS